MGHLGLWILGFIGYVKNSSIEVTLGAEMIISENDKRFHYS
jgi:hypothetical protein